MSKKYIKFLEHKNNQYRQVQFFILIMFYQELTTRIQNLQLMYSEQSVPHFCWLTNFRQLVPIWNGTFYPKPLPDELFNDLMLAGYPNEVQLSLWSINLFPQWRQIDLQQEHINKLFSQKQLLNPVVKWPQKRNCLT